MRSARLSRTLRRALPAALCLALWPGRARAFIFHEHAAIMSRAIEELPPEQRARLDAAWALVRKLPDLARLCADPARMREGGRDGAWCVGLAAMPALAGDHSCSPGDLDELVRTADWIGLVTKDAEEGGADFDRAGPDVAARVDRWAMHNLELQVDDLEYRSRAAAGDTHFQIPRVSDELGLHLSRVLSTGSKANAVAAYGNFHAAALHLAGRLAKEGKRQDARALWAVLLIESFGLHFLEDSFSTGHVVGAWGSSAQRKGTHDYYSEHGLSVQLWGDSRFYHGHGDAFLAEEDWSRSSRAVGASLEQLLDTLEKGPGEDVMYGRPWYPDANVCITNTVPLGLDGLAESRLLEAIMLRTMKPAPEAPRQADFIGEVGPFVSVLVSGEAELNDAARPMGHAAMGIGGGLALEGVTAQAHDVSYSATLVMALVGGGEQIGPTVGVGGVIHMPWAYVPGDGLFWGLLAIADVVHVPFVTSADGPWHIQRKHSLSRNLTLQFSLLRTASVLYFPKHRLEDGRTTGRLELSTPVLTLQLAHAYAAPMASALRVDLGLRYAHLSEPGSLDGDAFGVGLSLSADLRIFP